MAGYWPRSFFASLWTSTSSRSINTQKKNLANIQPSRPHTWSLTHTYCSWSLLWTNAHEYSTFGFSTSKFVFKRIKNVFNLYCKVYSISFKKNLQILPLCFPSQFCFLRQQMESSLDLLGLPGWGIHLSSYLMSWRYWVALHQRPVRNSRHHDKMPHPNFEIFLVRLCPISGNNKMYFILISKTVGGTVVEINHLNTSQGCSKESTTPAL